MDGLLVAARTVHFLSAMLLFGELVFALAVATPVWLRAGEATREGSRKVRPLSLTWIAWMLVASIVSGAVWLAVDAALVSDLPLARALNGHNLALVSTSTVFGRLWLWRFGLAVALGVVLMAIGRSSGKSSRAYLAVAAAGLAAGYLATLAGSGHAAAGEGSAGSIHAVSDIVHLLAAGAWLGALPALVFELGRAQPPELGARVARRFSTLGLASVGALVASGIGNAWYLVGDVPALIGTDYGRLLTLKLALFAAMVALAAVNRASLQAPPGAEGAAQRGSLRSLRRNASMEIAAGVILVAIVGALGVMVPAAHQSPLWPFAYTLSWQAVQQTLAGGMSVVLLCSVALLAAAFALGCMLQGRWRRGMAALAASVAVGIGCAWILAVPAYPTTYAVSPVRYTTDAVVRGAGLYSDNCRVCHGAYGRGDGPAAASPAIIPTDLAAHGSSHRVGELFWWIAHGIAGTPMPAFSPRLGDADIWDLVQFLRAQSDAASAATLLGEHVQPWLSAIVAPDFTFERAGQGQESLRQAQGPITLLVLYTLPQSLPFLHALAGEASAFAEVGLRVVAIPLSAQSKPARPDPADERASASTIAIAQPDVAKGYAMFARSEGGPGNAPLVQVDYLIDRQGYVRARWLGAADSPLDRAAAVFDQAELLARERQRAPLPVGHVH